MSSLGRVEVGGMPWAPEAEAVNVSSCGGGASGLVSSLGRVEVGGKPCAPEAEAGRVSGGCAGVGWISPSGGCAGSVSSGGGGGGWISLSPGGGGASGGGGGGSASRWGYSRDLAQGAEARGSTVTGAEA